MRFRSAALVVTAFAVAMAYLEAAVVVYLQRLLAITPDTLFPLRGSEVVGNLAAIEAGREVATLVMLVALGCLIGRGWVGRLAWTAVAFGVWDVFYYVWLWLFVGWPHSPTAWDVLFLIPVPWAGPVWAPMAVSACLIGFGLATARRVNLGSMSRVGAGCVLGAVAGGLLVVLSFTANAPSLMSGGLPGWFPWPVFAVGVGLAGWSAAASLGAGPGAEGTTESHLS